MERVPRPLRTVQGLAQFGGVVHRPLGVFRAQAMRCDTAQVTPGFLDPQASAIRVCEGRRFFQK